MITIFRRVRERLIASGSITKYLFYAVGEILLVVVGILIALQVNNWNESRKKTELTTAYLTQLKNELATNLVSSKRVAETLERKDSLLVKITSTDYDKVAPESFGAGHFFIPLSVSTLILNKDSYQNFIRSTDEVQFRDQELINEIKFIYVELDDNLNTSSETILRFIEDYLYSITDEQPWFHQIQNGDFPESLTDYIKEDPSYMNKVVLSKTLYTGNHLNSIHSFQYRGFRLYQTLDSLLTSTGENAVDPGLMFRNFPDSVAQNLTGTYQIEDNEAEVHVKQENGSLVFDQGGDTYQLLERYNGDMYLPELNAVMSIRNNGDLYLYGEVSYLLKKRE